MQGIAPVYGQDDRTVLLIDSEKTLLDNNPGGHAGEDQTVLLSPANSSYPRAGGSSGVGNESGVCQWQTGTAGLRTGHNPLITAAQDLLTFGIELSEIEGDAPISDLRQRAVRGIRTFEAKGQAMGLSRHLWMAARYILCTYLDEMVVTSPWGGAHEWTQESLLSQFHGETYGGQGFFTMLQRACEEPSQNADLLELMFVILSLGFEGKYRVDPDGQRKLESLRDMIMAMVRRSRGEPAGSLHIGELAAAQEPPARNTPSIRSIALGVAACLCALQVTLYLLLDHRSSQLSAQIAELPAPVLAISD